MRECRIGFGTDSGAMLTRIPGFAEHRELQLMVEAGLSPMEAFAAPPAGTPECSACKQAR